MLVTMRVSVLLLLLPVVVVALLHLVCLVNACHGIGNKIGWMNACSIVFVVDGVNVSSQISAIWPKATVKILDERNTTTVTVHVIGDKQREMMMMESILAQNKDLILLERPYYFSEMGDDDDDVNNNNNNNNNNHYHHCRSLLDSSSSSSSNATTTMNESDSEKGKNIALWVGIGTVVFCVIGCCLAITRCCTR